MNEQLKTEGVRVGTAPSQLVPEDPHGAYYHRGPLLQTFLPITNGPHTYCRTILES